MVLRFMSEEVMEFAEDLSQEARRALVLGLKASLDMVLPLLKTLTERHFGLGVAATQQGDAKAARLHAAVVSAALGASLSCLATPCLLCLLHSLYVRLPSPRSFRFPMHRVCV
jgi:hypothetical protein